MNSLEPEDEITLKGLIEALKDKYENMVVQKEEEISEEEEREEIDDWFWIILSIKRIESQKINLPFNS